jgi:hypothetical protein
MSAPPTLLLLDAEQLQNSSSQLHNLAKNNFWITIGNFRNRQATITILFSFLLIHVPYCHWYALELSNSPSDWSPRKN